MQDNRGDRNLIRGRGARASSLLLAIVLAMPVGLTNSLFAQSSVNRDGLSITIQSVQTKVPGYALFHVVAYNTTGEARTLNGHITLNMQSPAGVPNPPPLVQGSCTVFLEVPPGARGEGDFPCKGKDYTYWSFFIDGIYPFLLEGNR